MPSPRLHGFGLQNDPGNEVGVTYMLIDEPPGTPLKLKKPFASTEQLRMVHDQWAGILCTFYKYPLDRIGSLSWKSQPKGDAISVGPIVGDRTGHIFSQIRPFRNAREYFPHSQIIASS